MPFLALNGTTFRIQSNGMGQKYNEHGTDRFRTFDGSMRVTRRGIYREWNGTTAILSYADAATLIALLVSANVPLALTGDLVGDETVAVMPILISNDPIHTAAGPLRRVVFTLHETPASLPTDTSAVPWAFLQRGVGRFSDDDGLIPAGEGEGVAVWADQTGNGRHWTQDGGIFHNTAVRPIVEGTAIKFGHTASPATCLESPSLVALSQVEMLLSVRADNDPAIDDAQQTLTSVVTIYPATDGHIYDEFFSSHLFDWGDQTDDLTEWNVFDVFSSATAGYAGRINNVVKVTGVEGVDFTYGNPSHFALGQLSGSDYFKGYIRALVIFDGILSPTQRASWYEYMRGATDEPPIA